MTSFGKSVKQQESGLMPQRTILPESEFRFGFVFTVKGVGVKSNTSRSPSASRGEVLISSSLWSFSVPKNHSPLSLSVSQSSGKRDQDHFGWLLSAERR